MQCGRASERQRSWAVSALGLVGDRHELPWNDPYARRVNYLARVPSLTDPSGGGVLDLR